ncbi:MAG: arylsulfatase A-like enzyme [Myxococcota bacterium]|jgi:arylsulfatase A-like enzyme
MSQWTSVLAIVLAGGCESEVPDAPLEEMPHVVLISVDTLRADHVGVYGSDVLTPSIDAFAQDSVRFAKAWPAATTTLASHSSMMTGRLPHNHGVPFNGAVLDPENVTLAEVLQGAGFSTIGVVGGTPVRASTGLDQGFDTYLGPIRPGTKGNRAISEALNGLTDSPLFLFVHYWDAHWPYTPPAPWDRMYRSDDLPLKGTFGEVRTLRADLRDGVADAPERSEAMKGAYAGAVSYTDSAIGALITDLKSRGLYDSSLIILTSDHGESTDEHWDYWTHGKSTYEVAVHVPLMIKLPGQTSAGTVVEMPVSLVDLYPTLLELLGLPASDAVDGVSLVDALMQRPQAHGPLFIEASAPSRRDEIDGSTWINTTNCAAVLDGTLKVHRCPWRETDEVYDLAADGAEQADLATTRTEDARPLFEVLEQARSTTAARTVRLEESKEMEEALKTLGYIE